MKILPITIFLFLLFSPFAMADKSYNVTGGTDTDFMLDERGQFNSDMTLDEVTAVRSLTDGKGGILVSDLDLDGEKEIIINDNGNIELYQDSTLTPLDSYQVSSSDFYSNMIAYDIDDDSYTEIIIADERDEYIYMLKYIEDSLLLNNTISLFTIENHENTTTTYGEFAIRCGRPENCLLAYTSSIKNPIVGAGAERFVYALYFNSTERGDALQLDGTGAGGFATHCFPAGQTISYDDVDGDSINEYVFSTMEYDQSIGDTGDDIHIFVVQAESNNTINEDLQITETANGEIGGNAVDEDCLQQDIDNYFSPVLVKDLDFGGNPELTIAYMNSATGTKASIYTSTGTLIDRHPDLAPLVEVESGGLLASNIVYGEFFTDLSPSGNAYGWFTYDDSDDTVLFTACSLSRTGVGVFDCAQFNYDKVRTWNVSSTSEALNTVIHSTQQSSVTTENVDLHEILSPYGVLSLNYGFLVDTMSLIYEPTEEDAYNIMIDVDDLDRTDLLQLTDSNLVYIDDGYSNEPPEIDDYTIDPCIDATWKINTSVEITIRPDDPDNDMVSARAVLYYDDSNEQDSGFSANFTDRTIITFSDFDVNKTIGSGSILLQVRDNFDTTKTNEIELPFSVGSNGVEFGDCKTEATDLIEATEEEGNFTATQTDYQNNAVTSGLTTLSGQTGMSELLIYLFIVLVINIGVVFTALERKDIHGSNIIGLVVAIDIFALVIGVYLGIISTGLVIIFAIIGLAVISIWLRNQFFSTG